MEIERKFLVKKLPDDLSRYNRIEMEQGYLNTNPVVRVRRENDDYVLTYKGDGLMARREENLPLNREAFANLIKKCDGRIISKTRYLIPLEGEMSERGLKAELDVFHKDLEGIVIVEVEFESMEDAQRFEAPDWFGEDVTMDGNYHNSFLSSAEDISELINKSKGNK